MNKERINLVPETEECSGCGACMTACPCHAISMQVTEDGCKYPVIDEQQCIGCGRCLQTCCYRKALHGSAPQAAFAAVGRDSMLVQNSASGGVFASLATKWIENGGLVAGAVMDCTDGVQVYHILSDRLEDVYRMQGSKYVQSDAWRCYDAVVEAIRAGKKTLFSGTPCQVAAIKRLTNNPDNLTTIDLICHGVPPVQMLDEYIRILQRRFNGKIVDFKFRDKSIGKEFCARIDVQRGRKKRRFYLSSARLSFYHYFLQGSIYRQSCYTCPYAGLERISDLTIGDYWGIEKHHMEEMQSGEMPRRKDWSCMLVNTEKGKRLLAQNGELLCLYPSRAEWVAEENHQLRHPTAKPENRKILLAGYKKRGYAAVEAEFLQSCGGKLRCCVRMIKEIRRNNRTYRSSEGHMT